MVNSVSVGVAFRDPDIVGGTIDNTPIGDTTRSSVKATTGNFSGAVTVTGVLTAPGGVVGTVTGNQLMPTATVAATGTNQATAAAVAAGFTLVSAADGTVGVKLPTAVAGTVVVLKNNVNAVLKVWPFVGDAVNAIAVDSNYVLAGLTSVYLVAYDATTWYSVPLLAS